MQGKDQRQTGDSTKKVPQQQQQSDAVNQQQGGSGADTRRFQDEAARDAVEERDLNFDDGEEGHDPSKGLGKGGL